MLSWYTEIEDWLLDPTNKDQDARSKTGFVQTAKAGPVTKLSALGISNPKLKKKARDFANSHKELDLEELISGINLLFKLEYTEARVLSYFIMERYKKKINKNSKLVFSFIDDKLIDQIDHWTTSDHLCINLLPYIEFDQEIIKNIQSWSRSGNFWRQRLSITAFLKKTDNPKNVPIVLGLIAQQMLSKNYYVRKAIPWVLSSYARKYPDKITFFVDTHFHHFNKTELRESIKHLSLDTQAEFITRYETKQGK